MRLLPSEQKDLLTCLMAKGYGQDDYQFRKKSGWIKILIRNEPTHFAYHRKKVTSLVDGQFVNNVQYRVRAYRKIHPMQDWSEVREAFHEWLKSIG